jgi:aspartate kinase
MDMLLTAGERISMALLAMALRLEGIEAISFTGSQSGIITDGAHGRARILEVRGDRIREELARGRVVIVAGFQGVSRGREVTTLGRGGSDTTAVALAGALHARCCEIYTDVPGVMTADPRTVPRARLVPHLHYRTALVLTGLGAGVLVPRAACLGYTLGVPMVVRSSLDDGPGTRIDQEVQVEGSLPVAVTCATPVELLDLPSEPAAEALEGLHVLALLQAGPDAPARALVQIPEGAHRPAGARVLASGALVSLVLSGEPGPDLLARARAVAAGLGVEARGVFAGLGHVSLLLDTDQADRVCSAWHREFLESDRPGAGA